MLPCELVAPDILMGEMLTAVSRLPLRRIFLNTSLAHDGIEASDWLQMIGKALSLNTEVI